MATSKTHQERLQQGSGAVFSLDRACSLLPVHASKARQWLEDRQLVHYLAGRPVVVWSEVLECLKDGQEPIAAPRKTVRLPRVKLV